MCLVLLLAAATAAWSQQIVFTPVQRAILEQRLSAFPAKDGDRQIAVQALFEQAGCKRENITLQRLPHYSLPNVICVLAGQTQDEILVGAHYDHIDDGDGVADNWSGASMLPSLFEALGKRPRHHTYVFIAFTAEERGLVGSEFYASHMSRDEKARLHAMVNLDTLGLSPTKVWRRQADDTLVQAVMRTAQTMKLPLAQLDFDKVGLSDSIPFKHRGMPSITFHSVMQENFHVLHSPRDRLKSINLDDYYDTYRLVSGYLAYLDQALPRPVQ